MVFVNQAETMAGVQKAVFEQVKDKVGKDPAVTRATELFFTQLDLAYITLQNLDNAIQHSANQVEQAMAEKGLKVEGTEGVE